jgi:hypothetical protein
MKRQTRVVTGEITLAVRLQGMYYGAFFGDNQSLIDYVNSQPLTSPLVCLGDGHEGVWNLGLASLLHPPVDGKFWTGIIEREKLYKVGGSLKRLKEAEALLWFRQVEVVKTLFTNCRLKQAKNFCAYLEQHQQRIVNYSYLLSVPTTMFSRLRSR